MERSSGLLMPIFSLPSKYGIGDFGKSSFEFIDFLNKSGQKFWQVLPLVQTGYGNSPYSSVSSTSFSPYFISIELLKDQGLLLEEELEFSLYNGKYIDYGFLYNARFPLLKKAFSRFDKQDKGFTAFVKKGTARDYALFMSLKYVNGQKHFYEWADKYKFRDKVALKNFEQDYQEEVLFWQFVQYMATTEWKAVKKYANKKGVSIIGDMPLYVALDSVDVWTNPHLYKLDENFVPKKVAGVPPDYFCAEGQLWGNPVFDYDVHKKDDFSWWVKRVKKALDNFDYIRIDHFRGLDRYYEVENGRPNAIVGEWVDVPSDQLFTAIHKGVDKTKIIAEDLGIIDDGVRELLKKTGYPGMKILSFAFDGQPDNLYLPQALPQNSVCYTGTHDNDTLMGLISGASEWDKNNLYNGVKNSLSVMGIDLEVFDDYSLARAVWELGFASNANLFITPLQDVLLCGSDMRINEPGTVKQQNWSIKFEKQDFNENVAYKIKTLTQKYHR